MNALNTQVGGSYYKNMTMQPIEFIERNNLGFCVGNIIKYICRYKDKNGVEDLKKARHYIDILIDFESEYTNIDEDNESQSPLVPQASIENTDESGPEEVNLKEEPSSIKVKNALDSILTSSSIIHNTLGSCANPDCVGNPDNYKPTTTPERQAYKQLMTDLYAEGKLTTLDRPYDAEDMLTWYK